VFITERNVTKSAAVTRGNPIPLNKESTIRSNGNVEGLIRV
jgi:hypothetical protein